MVPTNKPGLLSHAATEVNLEVEIKRIKTQILASDSPEDYKTESIRLVDLLSEFDLGRFLICNKGLNGYWTSYVVRYPETRTNVENELERWLLDSSPAFVATQERYKNFQKIINENLREDIKLASIPCGLMDDILRLDLQRFKNLNLMGADLDQDSLLRAEALAKDLGVDKYCSFYNCNAWDLPWNNELDILTTNGLNIYVHDDTMLTELYKSFYRAIKPGGMLLASFVTQPSSLDSNSPWLISDLNMPDFMRQANLFRILDVQWQSFKSEEFTSNLLREIGFKDIEIIYDAKKIFPTLIAKK